MSSGFNELEFSFFEKTFIPLTIEIMRLFPDGFVVGLGIFSLITLSYPYGVFFGSMIEAGIIFNLLRYFLRWANLSERFGNTAGSESPECNTGGVATFSGLAMFRYEPYKYPFPSAPIYLLTTAASYIFTTLNAQSKELEALGPAYSSRYYVSAILLFLLIGIFACFRFSYSCESFPNIIVSIVIGLIIGALLVKQNMKFFGPTSVNLLGIPLLSNRTANGKKLYVCPK